MNDFIDPFQHGYLKNQSASGRFSSISAPNLTEQPHFEAAPMTLFELLARIRATLQHAMPGTYRVIGELSDVRVASGGHCYFELVQKDEATDTSIASIRGNIWRNNYIRLAGAFERATGQRFETGIKVLVEVKVAYHEQFGLSLNVVGIDPSYTLGDIVRRRQAIIKQLEDDGIIDLNKELTLPRIIRRIAVVSAAGAAGYGDFCKQLADSSYEFTVKLFPAIMQGEKVEESVIGSLDAIASDEAVWDVVVIIRGGGASTDLGGFDSYLLAANVAQYPIPVLTGIGHERDESILDLVAHTRLKTPTAVAAFLIESRAEETAVFKALCQRLTHAAEATLQREEQRALRLRSRLTQSAVQTVANQRGRLTDNRRRLEVATLRSVNDRRSAQMRLAARLQLGLGQLTQRGLQQTARLEHRLLLSVQNYLVQKHQRIDYLSKVLHLARPERLLSMGYSLTLKDGRPISNATILEAGDVIETHFQQGIARSRIIETESTNESPTLPDDDAKENDL